MALFLLGAGGLGYVYSEARGTVADQKGQITTLQGKVDSQAKDLSTSESNLKAAQNDLTDAEETIEGLEACTAAVRNFFDSLDATQAEGEAAVREMIRVC
jgi:peptidoglycan hydrolase CwlO-like protein